MRVKVFLSFLAIFLISTFAYSNGETTLFTEKNVECLSEIYFSEGVTTPLYTKQKARKKFRRRAGIEPVIGHIKQDHRMQRNYLKGTMGDAINTMLAAAGYNLKHWLNRVIFVFETIYRKLIAEILNTLNQLHNRQTLMPVLSGLGK